jgi:DNA ligase D-like protein (predicted 3'-phosphoesterase)
MEPPVAGNFVIHRHQAKRLHYDLRLEYRGVLKSWALPKEPLDKPGVKRLAVAVPDHPLEYGDFEGTIPAGEYGAGEVAIWDRGPYLLEEAAPEQWIFSLKGKRLRGRFTLIKFQEPRNWFFMKMREISGSARPL